MHIAFIHPRSPSSEGTGAAHSATQIVHGLANAGHKIDVYCIREPKERDISEKINLHHLAGKSSHPHTNSRLNAEIRERQKDFQKYDLVHSYLMPLIPSIAKIGENSNTSTIVTLNAYGGICPKNDLLYLNEERCDKRSNLKCLNCIAHTENPSDDYGYWYKTVSQLYSLRLINSANDQLRYIDGFQALSSHVKQRYSEFGFPKEKIQVIPNILDENFMVPHQSDFSDPYRLLYVGSLDEHKGVQMFPDIVEQLDSTAKYQFELTIVGDGGLKSQLQKEFDQRNLTTRVNFAGHISNSELPQIYAKHDLFIYPGIWDEPFGRVFIESLAAGTPVVGTNVGAIDSITGDAGVVTDPTLEALVSKLDTVLMSSQIFNLAEETKSEAWKFTSEQVIQQFEQLYQNIQHHYQKETH